MYSFVSVAAPLFSVAGSVLAVDLITGVIHWAEDTWTAPGASPLLDRWIVRDNIEHHRLPGTIRAGNYWATNRVCIAFATVAAVVLAAFRVHAWEPYFIAALASQANQVHLWAHTANPPRWVAALQRAGLLQSRKQHAEHHKKPYARRYCAMTNYLNPVLDAVRFWRGLECLLVRSGARVYRATPARGGY